MQIPFALNCFIDTKDSLASFCFQKSSCISLGISWARESHVTLYLFKVPWPTSIFLLHLLESWDAVPPPPPTKIMWVCYDKEHLYLKENDPLSEHKGAPVLTVNSCQINRLLFCMLKLISLDFYLHCFALVLPFAITSMEGQWWQGGWT